MVLCMLAARQESALEKTIDNTVIPCVVTDAYGLNQDNLHMATGFVDLLCGLRHERGYYQDEYVENVRAKASIKLINPKGYTMVCLLTPDSDYTLTAAGGGSITLFDGWDASVFSGDSKVCVIPWQLAGDGEYIEIDNGNFSVNLRVIGTHTGPATTFTARSMPWTSMTDKAIWLRLTPAPSTSRMHAALMRQRRHSMRYLRI